MLQSIQECVQNKCVPLTVTMYSSVRACVQGCVNVSEHGFVCASGLMSWVCKTDYDCLPLVSVGTSCVHKCVSLCLSLLPVWMLCTGACVNVCLCVATLECKNASG